MNPSFEICMAKPLGCPCKAQKLFPYNGKTLQSSGKVVEWMLCSLGGHEKTAVNSPGCSLALTGEEIHKYGRVLQQQLTPTNLVEPLQIHTRAHKSSF